MAMPFENKINRKYLKDQKNFLQNLSNRGLNSKCHPLPIYYYKKLIELLNDQDVRVSYSITWSCY